MRAALAAALALAVSACGAPDSASQPDAPPEPATVNPGPGLEAPADEGPLETGDPTSPEAAVGLVLQYYGAIAEGDLRRAYEMWGPDGPVEESIDDFRRRYAGMTNVRASIEAPTEPEGAAGSIYVTVPVNVTAKTASGADQRFEGEVVLRRVNGVPGAEPWQRRWHIERSDLREVD